MVNNNATKTNDENTKKAIKIGNVIVNVRCRFTSKKSLYDIFFFIVNTKLNEKSA
jgi:hypothetical protein